MKYKITIEKIEVKPIIKSVYITDEELDKREPKRDQTSDNYRNVEVKAETKEEIYEQTIESENFNLKTVIDAFNTKGENETL